MSAEDKKRILLYTALIKTGRKTLKATADSAAKHFYRGCYFKLKFAVFSSVRVFKEQTQKDLD